jgi:serine protease AprX
MRNLWFFSILMLMPFNLFSQRLSDSTYWVSLADKSGSRFSLSAPEEFLSHKSLERRAKQNITITEEDIPVSQIYLDSLNNLGLTILGSSRWFNSVIIESNDTLLLDTLDRISFVSEFNYKIPRKKNNADFTISKKQETISYSHQSNHFDYGNAYPQIALINGNTLHNYGFMGSDIRIAVIDGGFYKADVYSAFDSLWNEGRILATRDFTHSGKDFFSTSSHGMSVLSTIAANLPGEIVGTAPKASFYLLKSEIVESETPLEEALWVLAAEFADSAGADIITSSLGYSVFGDPSLNYSYSDMNGKTTLVTRGAEKAFSKGMIIVISAGNEGKSSWKYITAPSDGLNVLSIGATDTSGNVASFSSRGPAADQRIKPDIVAVGKNAVIINSSGNVGKGNGTSFSAPQVAGMIACLWEAAPEKTNLEVIQAVRESASIFNNPNDSAGFGIPDFQLALNMLKQPEGKIPSGHLLVVPNPTQGIFEIHTDNLSYKEVKINIYDEMGNNYYSGQKTFNAGFIRITELMNQATGFYFIVVESDGKEYFTRFIIVKP